MMPPAYPRPAFFSNLLNLQSVPLMAEHGPFLFFMT
jgi:hypothetical protein